MKKLLSIVMLSLVFLITIQIAPISAQAPIESSNPWKVYTDPDYGFTLEYPSENWTAEITLENKWKPDYVIRRRISFKGPGLSLIQLDVWDKPKGMTLMEWLVMYQEHLAILPLDSKIPAEPNGKISGVPSVILVTDDTPKLAIALVSNDTNIFRFRYSAADAFQASDVYIHMLDSIKLSDTGGISELPLSELPEEAISSAEVSTLATSCFGAFTDSQNNAYRCDEPGCYHGNCTWWAAYRRDDIGETSWGDATSWYGSARSEGFAVCRRADAVCNPLPGAIAWYSTGHVAYVEDVNPFRVSEMNCYESSVNYPPGNEVVWVNLGELTPLISTPPDGYIYGHRDEPVALYDEKGFFTGNHLRFESPGSYNLPEWINDKTSSISVADDWAVKLYEHANQEGRCLRLDKDDLDLSDNGFDGNVSSIEVFYGVCPLPCPDELTLNVTGKLDSSGVCSLPPPPTDTTPPTANWSNPPNGNTIRSQTVTLQAGASDDSSGVNRVSFSAKYGGSWHSVHTDNTAPYEYSWDLCAAGVPDGDIELGLEAWDNAGNHYVYSEHSANYHVRKEYNCGSTGGGSWQAKYFNTRTCWDDNSRCDVDNPQHTESVSVAGGNVLLHKDWGSNSPGGSVNQDNWTGYFQTTLNFTPGEYVFYADHDDGLKLKIDGYGIHEKSSSGSNSKICNGQGGYVLSGDVPIKVYLREDGGDAKVKLWWSTDTSVCAPPGSVTGGPWNASYFNTRTCWDDHANCNGQTYTQNLPVPGGDTLLDKNWGTSSPGGSIWNDNWTGRFQATFNFPADRYVFYADHDDGLKLKFGNYGEHTKSSSGTNSIICDGSDGYYLSGNVPILLYLREDGGDARVKLRWSTDTSVCIPIPDAPTGVSASDGTFTDRVQVTWNESSYATDYEVWRSTSNNSGTATRIALAVPSTGYDDLSVTTGQTYYYWVKAKNSRGVSNFSSPNSGYALVLVPPAPTAVSASDGTYTDKVQVTWDPVSGATSYEVWRNTSDNSFSSTHIASPVTGTSYDDVNAVPGQMYYYWVRARNSYGTSDFSVSDTGYRELTPDAYIAINNVWTVALLSASAPPKSKFSVGETVRMKFEVDNKTGSTVDSVWNIWVSRPDSSIDYVETNASFGIGSGLRYIYSEPYVAPANPGIYTYNARVSWNNGQNQVERSITFEVASASGSPPDSILINEIDVGNPDWVELYNTESQAVSLTGWHLVTYASDGTVDRDYTLPAVVLQPGAYLVLHEGGGTNTTTDLYFDDNISVWVNDGSGAAALKTDNSAAVDFVRWAEAMAAPPSGTGWTGNDPDGPPTGTTLARITEVDTDSGDDWAIQDPTPGMRNSGDRTSIYLPILLKNSDGSNR